MDFSDFASYGAVTDTNYSPTHEAFTYPVAVDDSYLAQPYSMSPDLSTGGLFDCDSYFPTANRPLSSIEPSTFSPRDYNHGPSRASMPPALPPRQSYAPLDTPPSPTFNPTPPFGHLEPTSSGFFSTPSTGDEARQLQSPSSTEPSRRPSLKREPTDEDYLPSNVSNLANANTNATAASSRPPRKRGRPRLSQQPNPQPQNMTPTSNSPPTSASNAKQRRLPHNQVERKYRENLNAELERLRRAIPTLPQNAGADGGAMGQPKPSKAMVLAGAIEYIKSIERERDELRAECERLRALVG